MAVRLQRLLLATSLLLLLIVLPTAARSAQADTLPLAVARVQRQTLATEQMMDGVVEAVQQSTVSAQTAGRVEEILVDVNDYVPPGAPIIRIRNIEQRAGLNQAQAHLREAQARFQEAEADYNRTRRVYEKRVVTKAQMDAATASLDAAKARLEVAQAGVAQAKESLGYTTIHAPYGGVVLQRHVQVGEAVQPGTPLMSGFSLDELRVLANVPQRLIVPVRQYRHARVVLPQGEHSIAATKLTFFPYADPQSNGFKVRIDLPKKTTGLYPGMFVKTAFQVGTVSGLIIPKSALVQRGEVSGVYVVQDRQVSLRHVRPGQTAGDTVTILAGLEAGEHVALDPIQAGAYLKNQQQTGD